MDFVLASEQYQAARANIEAAVIVGVTPTTESVKEKRDEALQKVISTIQSIQTNANLIRDTSREFPEDISTYVKSLALFCGNLVSCGKDLASTLDDPQAQKQVLAAIKDVNVSVGSIIHSAKGFTTNPQNDNLSRLLMDAASQVSDSLSKINHRHFCNYSLGKLTNITTSIVPKTTVEDPLRS